jgi:hypothetical protein
MGNRKDVEVGPFDALHKLLGSTFQRMSMSEKLDCYFVDTSLMYLMVQVLAWTSLIPFVVN